MNLNNEVRDTPASLQTILKFLQLDKLINNEGIRQNSNHNYSFFTIHYSLIFIRGCSSAGRAPALQAGGQEFDSPHLHHGNKKLPMNIDNWILL